MENKEKEDIFVKNEKKKNNDKSIIISKTWNINWEDVIVNFFKNLFQK
jgi:hypothetical protein